MLSYLVLCATTLPCVSGTWREQLDAGTRARDRGNIYESIALLEEAVARAPDQAARVRAGTQLGLTLEQAGRLPEANRLLQSAYQQSSGAAHISVALALGNLAAAEHDPARARRYYREVIGAAGESSALQAAKLAAELNLTRLQAGGERVQQLQQLYPRLGGIDSVSLRARAYLSLGVLAGEERSAAALAYRSLSDARQLARQAGDSALQVQSADALAQLDEQQGRFADALQLNREGLALARTLPLGEVEALLMRLEWRDGRLDRQRGDDVGALAAELRAASHAEAIRQDLPIEDQSGRSTYQTLLRPLFADLVDLMLKDFDRLAADDKPARLNSVLEAIELTHQAEMQDYLGERCAVEPIRAVSAAPAAGVAVIYTVILEDRLEVIARTHDGLSHHAAPIAATALEQEVAGFRRQLLDADSREFLATAGRLYRALLEPFEGEFARAGVQELVIVPDRYLRLIPFAALHDGRGYVAERYVVSSVTGLTMTAAGLRGVRANSLLAGLSAPGPVVDKLIDLGFVASGERGAGANALVPATPEQRALQVYGEQAPPAAQAAAPAAQGAAESALRKQLLLPAVETEIQALGHLGRNVSLLNADFTVARFEREVRTGRYSVIHVATHAYFGDNAQQSFLLAFDNLIPMNDLQSVISDKGAEGSGIELLTLSACDTAKGNDRAPLGFAGAAIKAQARSVVGTLWPVDDEAAEQLMQAFYANLHHSGKAQALTQAQRTLIGLPRFSHPYYWAPVVLIGEWN